MEIELTKMSSKGQVVIPKNIRNDIEEGEKLVVIKNGRQIILERAKDLDPKLKENLEFARRTEEAWKSYDRGEFIQMDYDNFLKEVRKW